MTKKISIAVLLLLTTSFAWAQTELSLKEAVNYALQHKADAVKAKLDIENSSYLIDEARANALPQINASGSITHNPILQKTALSMGGESMVIKMGRPWQSTAAVQLNQQLFNMAVFQGLKAAKSTRAFYQINAELTDEQIIEKVANSYYEVFKTRSQLKTIDQTIQNTTRVRDVIESLTKSGLAKKIDLDRINVSLNNLKSARQQLDNAAKLQENALKFLIGMDISNEITLSESDFTATTTLYSKEDININKRTEIKLLDQRGYLLHLNKKATEARGYPALSLVANYGYFGLGGEFPFFAGKNNPNVYWSDFASIGLNLSIPIFNGFSNRAKVQQTKVDILKHEADVKDTRLALDLAVENAFTQINNAQITLSNQESNLALAKEVLENIENNYKNGLASLTDLLDAETSYSDAQNNYTNAIMDYKLAEIQLIKAKGELKSYYTTE
jgi:outer membrane protein